MQDDQRLVFKIILIGDPSVGKTSLRRRYIGDGFHHNYQMTIGADFSTKRHSSDGRECVFQIWDLSGQESFKSVRKIYYRNTHGIVLVFDLTNDVSLENSVKWIEEYRASAYFNDKIPCILVGNKLDLEKVDDVEKYELYRLKIENLMRNHTIVYFSSALTGENVELIFDKLMELIIS